MLESLFGLKGRVALVAGAGGLGAGMAEALGQAGATVVAADLSLKNAEEAARRAREAGGAAAALTFDIMDHASIEKLFDETLRQMGRLDILVNSVGIARMGAAVDLTPADWNTVIHAFLSGVFYCCQMAARKAMIPQKYGKIINIASMSGVVVTGNRGSSYAAAKAGLIHLSRALATEWASYGIRVNAISPGYMRTALTEGMLKDPDTYNHIVASVPAGRVGEPKDLAGAVVFLASDASDYVLAHNLVIDGGYTAW
jgi:NAD(P)-dependent dehydrogenase (short-subunit alcohol dehydrogenase family)